MTRGVMERKDAKAVQLTPVGRERTALSTVKTDANFPNDIPGERIELAVVEVRRQLGLITDALNAIDAMNGIAAAGSVVDARTAAKLTEKAADEKFADRMKRLEAEAQAAVFASLDEPPSDVTPDVTSGWVCPTHKAVNLVTLTSRKGRTYRACKGCNNFEH